jgi:predicted GNAT family acetyltransferase
VDTTDAYSVKLLTPGTWDGFAALVEANNGVWGGCWCMGFHPEGVGEGRTPEGNREAKRAHTVRGTVHQVLVYDENDACVGWCQYGSPAELPNIKNPAKYAQAAVELPTWRIGCIFTGSTHRGHGVARAAVGAVLAEIRAAGGGVVEAYPEQTTDRTPQRGAYLHTGPEELFAGFGFVRDRQIAKWRWVMRLEL